MDTRLQLIIEAQNKATAEINRIANDVTGLGKVTQASSGQMSAGLALATKAFGALSVAAIAYQAVDIAKSFVDAGLAAERMNIGLKSALGGMNAAADAQQFLRKESERLGIVFTDQIKSFVSLSAAAKGTALEGEKTRQIFSAVAEASTALGLTSDATSGALQAIQQMMSKGTVSAEELRGQLGERLPGAFNVAAEAMGVTTQELGKMLEQGEVVASEFLPKFAEALKNQYSGAMDGAAKSTQAAVNRMNNAWDEAKRAIGEALLPYVASAAEAINSAIQSIAPSTLEAKAAKLRNDIAELKKQISQPFYFGGDKELLKEMEADLIRVEREMAGVGNRTGEWAKGVRDLQKDYSATFAKGDSWLAFYKGLDDAANKRLPSITGAHEDAEKAASKQAAAVERLNRGLYDLAVNSEKDWIQSTESRSFISDEAYNKYLSDMEKMRQADEKAMEKYLSQGEDKWAESVQNRSYVSDEEYNKMLLKQQKDSEKANEKAAEVYRDIWESAYKNMQSALADSLFSMWEEGIDGFGDFFDRVLDIFMRMLAEMAAAWAASMIVKESGNLFDDVVDVVGDVVDWMGFASGGTYPANQPFWAGEEGPELIFPSGTGQVLSHPDSVKFASDYGIRVPGYASGTASYSGFMSNMGAFEETVGVAADELVNLADSVNGVAESANEAGKAMQESTSAIGESIEAQADLSKAVESAASVSIDFGDAVDVGKMALGGLTAVTGLLSGNMLGAVKGISMFTSGLFGLSETMISSMSSQEIAALAAQQAVDEQIDAQQSAIEGLLDVANAAEDAATSMAGIGADIDNEGDRTGGYGSETGGYGTSEGGADVYATGGTYDPNKLFWAGEQGAELIDPRSRTVLNHQDSIRYAMSHGINIPGYADGTTSLPYAVYDPYAISSGTTELEMWEDLYETTADYMDLLTDTQKELEEINTYYEEQIALAQQLGVTEEELTSIYQMQAAAVAELTETFWTDYAEYVDEMLGLTTEMGSAIDEVNQYYAEAIADATALGASQEELNQMYADQAAILQEIAQTFFDDYTEYVTQQLGYTTALGQAIDEVNQYYEEAIANAIALGVSQETLNQMYANQQAIIDKIIQDSIDSTMDQSASLAQPTADTLDEQLAQQISDLNKQFEEMVKTLEEAASEGADVSDEMAQLSADYNQAMANLMAEMAETILSKFDSVNEQIAYYNWQIANPGASQSKYYGDQAIALYNAMTSKPENLNLENISDTADLVNQWYSSIMSEIEQYAQQMANAVNQARQSIENLSDAIDDTIQSIKYSKYNLSLPTQKAATAAGDYASLLAKATSGDATTADIQAYQDFVEIYLQQAQEAYKSSQTYQDIYAQVMKDLEDVKNNVNSVTFEETLINELMNTNDSMAKAADYMDEASVALGYTAQELAEINGTYLMAQELITGLINDYMASGDTTTDTTENVSGAYAAANLLLAGNAAWMSSVGDTWSIVETITFWSTILYDQLVKIVTNTGKITGGGTTEVLAKIDTAIGYASAASGYASTAASNASSAYDYAYEAASNTYDPGSGNYAGGTAATLAALARYNTYYNNLNMGYPKLAEGGIITSPTMAMIGEAGYPEAVIPLKDGYVHAKITGSGGGMNDPEIKALLRQLVVQGAQNQQVSLVLDNGQTLTGYLSSVADNVRVSGANRSRMATRRGYLN